MDPLQAHRSFFGTLITAKVGIPPGSELASAFASTPREEFVGLPPWKVYTRAGYIETPTDDPIFLYQDVVVSLGADGPLNNGEPTLHALCLSALNVNKGERVVHVGAGTGYYTSLLAKLTGDTGMVDAFEIDQSLAKRAAENLAGFPYVTVHHRSGSDGPIPQCDVLYVNAGATSPLATWLDSLLPKGRLLFPLTPSEGVGGMLLVTRMEDGALKANFLCQAQFVPCLGARSEIEAQMLTEAFRNGKASKVNSLHRDDVPDDSCWCAGPGWWLSSR